MMPKITTRSIFWVTFHCTLFASSVIGVIFILVARGHYTIDILVAYFITTTTFYIYHTLVYNKSLRAAHPKNYIANFWWWYLMKYLEYDHVICSGGNSRSNGVCPKCDSVNTDVPRRFGWPFSWQNTEDRRSTSLQRLLQSQT